MSLSNYEDKIKPTEYIGDFITRFRCLYPTHKIVQTSGVFDIIHPGHIAYLQYAKTLGGLHVLTINGERRTQELKGDVYMPLGHRLTVLAAFECVDIITWFEEDTPTEIIEKIKPDLFVKGTEYGDRPIPERETVEKYGELVIVPEEFHLAVTSSDIKERIYAKKDIEAMKGDE
jgi:rfaE bifunctional protein nucleotidyltransferase chain/domain